LLNAQCKMDHIRQKPWFDDGLPYIREYANLTYLQHIARSTGICKTVL